MYEKRLNYIIQKAYTKDDYSPEFVYPGIKKYVSLIEEILKHELVLEIEDSNSVFYKDLAPEDRLEKIADFTYDTYRWYCDSPESDPKNIFIDEYKEEIERRKVFFGL